MIHKKRLKRKITLLQCKYYAAIAIVAGIFTICSDNAVSATANKVNNKKLAIEQEFISEKKAKNIILKHANLSESDITVVKLVTYEKQQHHLYDMEFLTSTKKYSYEIDAVTGDVIAYYTKNRTGKSASSDTNQTNSSVTTSKTNKNKTTLIGKKKAKSIVLKHAGVTASSISKYDIDLDDDDDTMIYEIEFVHEKMEYEYEIDAHTGKILHYEVERD